MYKHPVYVVGKLDYKKPKKSTIGFVSVFFPATKNYLCPSTLQNNATSGFLKRNMVISTGGKSATEHLADSGHFKRHKAIRC